MVVCGSLLLGYQASVWTHSPPTVWVEVLLLGRQLSARDRRDPLVVLPVQLASLFGNRPAACGARRPGRQLLGRWKGPIMRWDPDTGGKMSGVAKQRPEIQSNHAQIDRCHCARNARRHLATSLKNEVCKKMVKGPVGLSGPYG
ncbi:hypothetical protein NQZ68_015622 [Dissostichus eleginoides]|nr:hypothetical protein NQZ68_015622 [Dissostichus eleginoides]